MSGHCRLRFAVIPDFPTNAVISRLPATTAATMTPKHVISGDWTPPSLRKPSDHSTCTGFLFWGRTWVVWRVPLCENSRLIDADFLRPAHLLPQRKFKIFFTIFCRLGFGRLAHPTPTSSNSALSLAPATLLGFQHFFISIGTPTYLSYSRWPHFWGLNTLDKNPSGNNCLRLQKSTWMAVLEQHVFAVVKREKRFCTYMVHKWKLNAELCV